MDAVVSKHGSGLIIAESLNKATKAACATLSEKGARVQRRGSMVTEMAGPMTIEIIKPRRNLLALHGRNANPWVQLCEFPWLMAGRNDIAWLQHYLPKAADFSDDGRTWRAGYGPRLRKWDDAVDQLTGVCDMLSVDRNSRRAVISLWDPISDTESGSVDYPCSNWLHFQVNARHQLDLTVVMRSNDLIWGFSGVNVTNFTLIQMAVAAHLGLELGVYRHVADNLHYYDRHADMVQEILTINSPCFYDTGLVEDYCPFPVLWDIENITNEAENALDFVLGRRLREVDFPWLADEVHASFLSVWFADWAYFMLTHELVAKPRPIEEMAEILKHIRTKDMRFVAANYLLFREMKEGRTDAKGLYNAVVTAGLGDTLFDGGRAASDGTLDSVVAIPYPTPTPPNADSPAAL